MCCRIVYDLHFSSLNGEKELFRFAWSSKLYLFGRTAAYLNTPFRVHLSMARFVCFELDLYVDISVWFRLSGSEAHNNESSDYGDIFITSGLRTNGVDKARICRHLCLKYIITKSHQFYKTEEWCYICTWQQYACNLHCYTLLSWLEIPETALESFSPTWVPVMKSFKIWSNCHELSPCHKETDSYVQAQRESFWWTAITASLSHLHHLTTTMLKVELPLYIPWSRIQRQ